MDLKHIWKESGQKSTIQAFLNELFKFNLLFFKIVSWFYFNYLKIRQEMQREN